MKRKDFADFVGIGPSMVTKYADDGLIVFSSPKDVDVPATLAALAGRLNEEKRQDALARWEAGDIAAPANEHATSAPPLSARNAKQALDELRRDSVALDLAKRAGDVIPIADVEAVIVSAIAELQSAFDVEASATTDRLIIDLGLAADRHPVLKRQLRSLLTRARARFAAAMASLADEAPPETEAKDEAEQA